MRSQLLWFHLVWRLLVVLRSEDSSNRPMFCWHLGTTKSDMQHKHSNRLNDYCYTSYDVESLLRPCFTKSTIWRRLSRGKVESSSWFSKKFSNKCSMVDSTLTWKYKTGNRDTNIIRTSNYVIGNEADNISTLQYFMMLYVTCSSLVTVGIPSTSKWIRGTDNTENWWFVSNSE